MSSTVIAKNIQIGTSGTATNNFNWYQPASPDGTIRLGVGNYGATTLDAVTVSNSGNFGLGVTPSAWGTGFRRAFQVGTGAALSGVASGASDYFALTGNAYLDSGPTYRYISSTTATRYEASAAEHRWYTAASGTAGNAISFTQALALGHNQTLALQGATPQAGTGITFPATQSASSNANTLDDYEEGTWTPLLLATGSNPTVSYNEQFGRYIKIGKQVTAQFYLATNSYSGGSGTVRIGGLPFVANADRQPTSAAGAFYVINFQGASGHTFPSIGVIPSTPQAEPLIYSNNGAWAGMGITGIPPATYGAIQATLTYLTD